MQSRGKCKLNARFLAPASSLCVRTIVGSPDDLIRLEQDGRGNREAEALGRLEVDHQLECGGLFDGQVGGLGPLQELIHIGGGAMKVGGEAWPIGEEPPASTNSRSGNSAGSRCLAARPTTWRR